MNSANQTVNSSVAQFYVEPETLDQAKKIGDYLANSFSLSFRKQFKDNYGSIKDDSSYSSRYVDWNDPSVNLTKRDPSNPLYQLWYNMNDRCYR